MNRWRCWLLVCCSLSACGSEANPAFSCSDSQCSDPDFPYCDVDGSIGGIPEACVSVTCTAGAFESCRGDSIALTCNNSGTSYDEVQCAHGCDDASGGCRLCEANQTVCQNGVVASCDANGRQTSTTECPLGCFEDQPRCRDIDPSNHLGTYYDMVPTPADLDLSNGFWNANVATGVLLGPAGAMLTPPSYLVPSVSGGSPLRVFVVGALKLKDLNTYGDEFTAIAFLASGDVSLLGTITFTTGYVADNTCTAGKGYSEEEQANGAVIGEGPGGGGAAAAGSKGGIVIDPFDVPPQIGGTATGTDDLQPLMGGCVGGGFTNTNTNRNDPFGAAGGGAIQISSRTLITISGTIDASGGDGTAYGKGPGDTNTQGGGGGGNILLEAPKVALAANSLLDAHGGDGFGCSPGTAICGTPGKGGTGTSAPTVGGSISFTTALPNTTEFYAGGGGGGVGRVRVNTPSNSYTSDSTSTQNALVTTGPLKTR